MKAGIHPEYHEITVLCSCGRKLMTRSALAGGSLNIEVCDSCHPYYTGKQKVLAAGNVEKFMNRFNKLGQPKPEAKKPEQVKKGKK